MTGRTAPPTTDDRRPTTMYRVLETLERIDGAGVHAVGEILQVEQLHPASISILMERTIIMPHLDPAALAALPAYA